MTRTEIDISTFLVFSDFQKNTFSNFKTSSKSFSFNSVIRYFPGLKEVCVSSELFCFTLLVP